ncbi:MAG: hypothetical protein IPP64_05320 [Bacteroidetes bacterium]|nr:hypothetical protein [Bacteroidota bacterium]
MTINTTSSLNRNFGLDLIRVVAISLVLIAHAGITSVYGLKIGGLGVEIFFVLSGFLIGQILIRDFSGGVNSRYHELLGKKMV